MKFTSQQIADLINGKIEGDKNILVNKFSKIEDVHHFELKNGQKSVFTPTSEAPRGAFSYSECLQSSKWVRNVPESSQNLLACSYLV